jgi:hypothetical protein
VKEVLPGDRIGVRLSLNGEDDDDDGMMVVVKMMMIMMVMIMMVMMMMMMMMTILVLLLLLLLLLLLMMMMIILAGVFGGMGSEDNVEQFTYTADVLNIHNLAYLHIVDGLGERRILMISVMIVPMMRSLVLHVPTHGP